MKIIKAFMLTMYLIIALPVIVLFLFIRMSWLASDNLMDALITAMEEKK